MIFQTQIPRKFPDKNTYDHHHHNFVYVCVCVCLLEKYKISNCLRCQNLFLFYITHHDSKKMNLLFASFASLLFLRWDGFLIFFYPSQRSVRDQEDKSIFMLVMKFDSVYGVHYIFLRHLTFFLTRYLFLDFDWICAVRLFGIETLDGIMVG